MRVSRGRVIGFFAAAAVLYAVLAGPWLRVGEVYTREYRALANHIFGTFGRGEVRFHEPIPGERLDTSVSIRLPPSRQVATRGHSARLTGYLPTVMTLALVAGTPLPWRRWLLAVFWCLAWLHVFIGVRVVLVLVQFFSVEGPWAMFHPGPVVKGSVEAATEVLVVSPTCSFLVPVLVWAAVCVRRRDVEAVRRSVSGGCRGG